MRSASVIVVTWKPNPASAVLTVGSTRQFSATFVGSTDGSNPSVTWESSDTTEATVPATVEIPADQSVANFDINAIDDTLPDGEFEYALDSGERIRVQIGPDRSDGSRRGIGCSLRDRQDQVCFVGRVAATGRIDGQVIRLDAQAAAYGGRATADGTVRYGRISIADGGNYSVLSGVDGSFRLQHLPAGTFTNRKRPFAPNTQVAPPPLMSKVAGGSMTFVARTTADSVSSACRRSVVRLSPGLSPARTTNSGATMKVSAPTSTSTRSATRRCGRCLKHARHVDAERGANTEHALARDVAAGALERREPWGVWGGELFLQGVVIPRKRPRGRPRKNEVAA